MDKIPESESTVMAGVVKLLACKATVSS